MEELTSGKKTDIAVKSEAKAGQKTIKENEVLTYTFEEAVAASKTYFKGDDLASTVWVNKYG